MTDKSRTERRLLASIRQVKTGDETPLDSNGDPEPAAAKPSTAKPQASPLRAEPKPGSAKASVKAKAKPAQQRTGYQSARRVWPD